MFIPKYTITHKLLANIARISALVAKLNTRRSPQVVLVELERTARAISSFASTSIEGNPLALTEVKKILKSRPEHIRDSEREVLNYNQALIDLNKQLELENIGLSVALVLKIHKQVMDGLLPALELGKLRQNPVVVHDPRTGKVVYLPPDVEEVEDLMAELINFVNSTKSTIDPLIVAGIFHKQMVLIHPFPDGNGRTTRLVTKLLLANMGLNTFNLFSFEQYYNQNVTKYFQMVGEYGDYHELVGHVDFTSWLEYFTAGIIDELLRVEALLPVVGSMPETRLENYHNVILRYIRNHGFIADRDYAKLTKRAKSTRAKDFQRLLRLGLIERRAKGKATYYVLKEA